MENSAIMGMIALIVSVGGAIVAVVNHKRLRSDCCGRKLSVSVDIENTTPQENLSGHSDKSGNPDKVRRPSVMVPDIRTSG